MRAFIFACGHGADRSQMSSAFARVAETVHLSQSQECADRSEPSYAIRSRENHQDSGWTGVENQRAILEIHLGLGFGLLSYFDNEIR
jgi:hypothetical protein